MPCECSLPWKSCIPGESFAVGPDAGMIVRSLQDRQAQAQQTDRSVQAPCACL